MEPGKAHKKSHFLLHSTRPTTARFICSDAIVVAHQQNLCTRKAERERSIKSFSARSSLDCFMHMTKNAVRSNLEYKSLRFPHFCAVIHCRGEIYSHLRGREHLQCLGRAEYRVRNWDKTGNALAVQRFTSLVDTIRHNPFMRQKARVFIPLSSGLKFNCLSESFLFMTFSPSHRPSTI